MEMHRGLQSVSWDERRRFYRTMADDIKRWRMEWDIGIGKELRGREGLPAIQQLERCHHVEHNVWKAMLEDQNRKLQNYRPLFLRDNHRPEQTPTASQSLASDLQKNSEDDESGHQSNIQELEVCERNTRTIQKQAVAAPKEEPPTCTRNIAESRPGTILDMQKQEPDHSQKEAIRAESLAARIAQMIVDKQSNMSKSNLSLPGDVMLDQEGYASCQYYL